MFRLHSFDRIVKKLLFQLLQCACVRIFVLCILMCAFLLSNDRSKFLFEISIRAMLMSMLMLMLMLILMFVLCFTYECNRTNDEQHTQPYTHTLSSMI